MLDGVNGYAQDKDAYLKRMKRIEGQVRGIAKMIEDDKYCIDVLTQVSAATKALEAVALGLLDEHLRHCVSEAVAQGGQAADDKVAEASAAIARLVRS
ncbi:metal-sensitive transcriptional regulator [Pseudonocardia petroleophila]|uniref:Metal-sensitive transcriptional regulator n=1 Tax=Pseudonocardia petroleophila TaxID=37331 RepID=A0A7G7MIE3_9PSEU|nr:metal-sensitive transcriptional regulator [Pseudonocardia petroleophila]